MKIIPKNYGSIPHLSTSKLGQQADKKIEIGQENLLTKKVRDWMDLVIVTEKLDGSNVGVIRKDHVLIAITRSGYEASTSPYEQHHIFKKWVQGSAEIFSMLPEGWRVCGEWMMESCGTKYDISNESPFVAFDVIDEFNKRISYIQFRDFCGASHINVAPLLSIGQPVSIKNALKLLGDGIYGKPEKPEGVVYRMERAGSFDFMAKYVRQDKEDGKYMDRHLINKGFSS